MCGKEAACSHVFTQPVEPCSGPSGNLALWQVHLLPEACGGSPPKWVFHSWARFGSLEPTLCPETESPLPDLSVPDCPVSLGQAEPWVISS